MEKQVFTLIEEDFQMIARERIGRDLTEDEMRTTIRNFEHGIEWAEVAQIAVDEAVEHQ